MSDASSSDEEDLASTHLSTLSSLSSSLADVQRILGPLLDKPWDDTLADLDGLQRAKMNVLVAYGICDLVWILLKVRGVDPAKHAVMRELQRIQTYYGKVKEAENPPARQKLDVPAAGRFIAHAIPKAQRTTNLNTAPTGPSGSGIGNGSSSGDASATGAAEEEQPPVGRATRFKHLDRPATALSAEGESMIDVVDLEADPAEASTSAATAAAGPAGVASPAQASASKKKQKKQKKRKGGDVGTPAGSPLKRTIDEADPVTESPASTPAKKKRKKKNGKSGASSAAPSPAPSKSSQA